MASLRAKLDSTATGDEIARLPAGFFEAIGFIRDAIEESRNVGIAGDALAAALMSEALPRLVEAHGAQGCARILHLLAATVETGRTGVCMPS